MPNFNSAVCTPEAVGELMMERYVKRVREEDRTSVAPDGAASASPHPKTRERLGDPYRGVDMPKAKQPDPPSGR